MIGIQVMAGVEVRLILRVDNGFVVMGYKELGDTLQADIWLEKVNSKIPRSEFES